MLLGNYDIIDLIGYKKVNTSNIQWCRNDLVR